MCPSGAGADDDGAGAATAVDSGSPRRNRPRSPAGAQSSRRSRCISRTSSIHKPVVLFGMERERPDGIVWGGAIFSNSFGQPSAYVSAASASTAGAPGLRSTRSGRPGCSTATWASTRTRFRSTTTASRPVISAVSAGNSLPSSPARSICSATRACSVIDVDRAAVRSRVRARQRPRPNALGASQNRRMTDLSLARHIGAILARAGEDADPAETAEWCEALDALTAAHGPARARFLLDALLAHARRRGVALAAVDGDAVRQHDRARGRSRRSPATWRSSSASPR